DRSSKTKDVARVMISNGNITTYKLLEETSRSSGLFLGEVKLGNGSINGRSIYSLPNDTIELRYGDLQKSIPVFGNIWSDDPPIFVEPPINILTFHVGGPMEMTISGLDPDGEEVTLYSEEMPTWMTLDDWRLRGTPSDDDIGSGEIVLKLSDGEDTTELRLGYFVTMPIPSIDLPDGPYEPLEGLSYRLDIGISGIVNDTNMVFNSTGPQDTSWMTFHSEGFMEGVPTNRDVGLWSILLSITNPGNIMTKASWSIEVINARPDITAPGAVSTDIYEALSLDVLSSYEGDGLTFYTVEGPEGLAIAPVSGLISWSPDASQVGTHLVNVSVFDGHGETNFWVIQIEVYDPPLELLTDLPTVISSHQFLSIIINARGKGTVNYTYEGLPHWMKLDRGNNTLSGVPWNIDSGEHPVAISISDPTDRVNRIIWNISVIPDHSMSDPSISITSYDNDNGKLNVTFAILNLTRPLSSITLTLTDSRGISVSYPREDLSIEPFSMDILNMKDPITAYLEVEIDGRRINTSTTISKVNEDKVEEYSFTWLLLTLLLISFISSLAILLSVERTSYPIQKYIFVGGRIREKDLIPIIQHQPGIRYREISKEVSMTRREIMATLSHLERSSEVRMMIVGSSVRFYPTVGSFVDGHLVLNREEIKIIRELLDVRNMGEERLLEETGLRLLKLRRYAGILDLKGIITISTSGKERLYSLSRGQRSKVKIYMGVQEN
ncbi:MAG: hypothetical protein KAH57_09505, partial [Thermoplasmata archaeon]|nr:hypothetical protein [Thermoplasmata archaeon]